MTGMLCEMRDGFCKSRDKRPADYGLENVLARKVRRESPANTIDYTAAKFDLTTGRARGVVNGTASLTTLNAAIKKGGWPLVAELVGELLGESLEQWIEKEARRKRHESEQYDRLERNLRSMASDLPAALRLDSVGRN